MLFTPAYIPKLLKAYTPKLLKIVACHNLLQACHYESRKHTDCQHT